MQMDDIQSWWEVPSIAHFCSLFRAAFNLLDFDIEELEEALLTDGTEDSGSSLLQELIVRLLCGCLGNHDISTFNYQMFLRRLFRQKCQEYGRDNPFNTDMDFQFLPLRTKVEILHALCDFRLDADDVQDLLKNLESDSLRVEPLGHDENNSAYWYFYGTRLYREDYPKTKKKTKEKRRKGKDEKKRKKHGRSSLDLDGEEKGTGVWQVVCFTEQDWDRITEGFKDSRSKAEKELYHTLSEDFLPEIPRLFAEKERLQRKRLLEYQPRRQSSRLEKLKQQKEEEESLQKTMEKEEKEQQFRRKQEQENKDKGRHSRNVKERASRVLVRSQSRTTSECGSTGSFVESAIENKPTQSTTFVGRQTNNSLSSATGQIVIQGLRRKLRSSQVFRQTEEDLQTGMYKILEFIKNHEDAWPFLEPVDEQYAPKYYSIITTPMDLQQMEDKLDDGEYMSFCEFKSDFQLIVNNCQKYNGTDNEYTEMVGNLQEAFQLAVDRYLESEPSSDEEVAVEFIEKAPEKVSTPRNNSRKKKKKEVVPQHEEEEEEKSSSLPPSMPPSPTGSDGSDKIPDAENDFEDKSDEPIEAPDSDESSTKDDGESKSCANNNNSNNNNNNNNSTKRKKKSSGAKNGPDIEALELATEQTLKDINKWLDDTPRYSEFSSASNSPSHFVSAEEFEVGSRVENEYRRNNKVEKPSRSKDSKDNSKKRSSKDSTKQMRRREVQRTIERLQPGKSKGNLISNIQNVGKVSEEGPPGKPKETRSCLFPVVDETTPKLSLGTVLGTDVLGFGVGQNKHNFDAENKEVQSVSVIEETPKTIIDVRPRTPEVPLENENMEEYTEKKDKEEMEIKSINKDNRQEKVMPNLSAWFKAFGAPKPTSGTKKRAESLQDGSSVEIISEERKNVSNIITVDLTVDKTISVKAHSVIVHDMPRQPVVVNPRFEDTDSQCSLQQKSNEDEMPSLLPLAAVHQGIPRQRKVSTGSNISERSSFSQDLMDTADGSSPHLSLDDRLNSYPAPYPSPLHQSPVSAATSVITSPRPEEGPKFASYPPLNGTIRVGFYQDTSFSQQKSSPEKSSNSSHSPKDQVHTSYPAYNPRMYPPHDPDDFLPYQNQRAGSPPATVESYENSYVSPLMTYYDTSKPLTDQYRAARTQETEVFSPNSTTEEISAPLPTICSSPQHSVEVIPFTVSSPSHASVVVSTVVQKPSVTVFPVKKRLYSEMESNGSVQSSGRYHVTPPPAHSLGTPPPAHSQSASRIHPSESLIVIDNSLHSRPICTLLEDSDKIVASSSEKLYNSKVSPICEPSLKKAEHMSKKHQSIRTLQSTAHIAFGSVDRLQQSSPETITEYPEKSSNPHRFSPSIKHTGTQPTQSYVSRSNSVRKHISVIPENSASFNEESPNSARIRHSNVPVITTHVSNPPSHQEYNSKLERPITIERSNKTASTLDNVQPVTESCRETTRSSRLHTSNTCSSPTSVHDRLKPNTTATLHGDMSYHRGPFSPVPPSPLGMEHLSLHGNLSNLSHVVDRFPASERLLSGLPSTPPYYNEKNLTSQHVFRQTVSSTLPTSISPSTAMALLSQPSPAVMTITYNHESQISPSSMPFNRSVPELPSVLPNKVSNMQASYGRSVQDLSGMLPTKDATPITAPTSFNRSVPDLQVIHTDKVSSNVNSTADYRSVTDLSSVISTKVTSPVDLKTYNQSVTDLSTVLPNKVLVPSSIGVPSSFTRSAAAAAAADYSLLSGKASDSQLASKPTRKRKSKQTPVTSSDVPIATTTTSSTAFQQYVGLNSSPNVSEPSAIALKTATVLTGSAFNFGSAHSGLGLYSTDKDGYPAYLEDYRTASSSYYIPAPDPNHDKINPASHPSAPTPSLPFPFTSHPRPPSYALAQAFINQSGLVDPTSTAPPLYQQYLHRHPEELLRHSGTSMVLHQGLLPPASYPPGYHPALGIRQTYDTLNRPTWL